MQYSLPSAADSMKSKHNCRGTADAQQMQQLGVREAETLAMHGSKHWERHPVLCGPHIATSHLHSTFIWRPAVLVGPTYWYTYAQYHTYQADGYPCPNSDIFRCRS
jgi:hypothetical protein